MNDHGRARHNPLAELADLGEALLAMYDSEEAERCLLELLASDSAMRAAIRYANRRVARDFDLVTADCFLQIAARSLRRAGYAA